MSKTLVENLLFDKFWTNLKSGRIFPKLGGQKLPFSQAMNLETEWQKLKNSGCESIMAKCLFQSGGLLSKNSSKSQILPNFWQNVQSGGLFNWTFSEWSQVPGHVLVTFWEIFRHFAFLSKFGRLLKMQIFEGDFFWKDIRSCSNLVQVKHWTNLVIAYSTGAVYLENCGCESILIFWTFCRMAKWLFQK